MVLIRLLELITGLLQVYPPIPTSQKPQKSDVVFFSQVEANLMRDFQQELPPNKASLLSTYHPSPCTMSDIWKPEFLNELVDGLSFTKDYSTDLIWQKKTDGKINSKKARHYAKTWFPMVFHHILDVEFHAFSLLCGIESNTRKHSNRGQNRHINVFVC